MSKKREKKKILDVYQRCVTNEENRKISIATTIKGGKRNKTGRSKWKRGEPKEKKRLKRKKGNNGIVKVKKNNVKRGG